MTRIAAVRNILERRKGDIQVADDVQNMCAALSIKPRVISCLLLNLISPYYSLAI